MESEEYAGVEPRTLSQLYRRNRLSAVSVGRGTLKPDSFRDRNSVLFRATTSIQRSLSFGSPTMACGSSRCSPTASASMSKNCKETISVLPRFPSTVGKAHQWRFLSRTVSLPISLRMAPHCWLPASKVQKAPPHFGLCPYPPDLLNG